MQVHGAERGRWRREVVVVNGRLVVLVPCSAQLLRIKRVIELLKLLHQLHVRDGLGEVLHTRGRASQVDVGFEVSLMLLAADVVVRVPGLMLVAANVLVRVSGRSRVDLWRRRIEVLHTRGGASQVDGSFEVALVFVAADVVVRVPGLMLVAANVLVRVSGRSWVDQRRWRRIYGR
jgi:hypothetical protein